MCGCVSVHVCERACECVLVRCVSVHESGSVCVLVSESMFQCV